jgi:hypothetical protein
MVNKLEWKDKMRKIRYATKKAGEGWGKKNINIAANMVKAMQSSKPTFQDKPEPTSITAILKTLIGEGER